MDEIFKTTIYKVKLVKESMSSFFIVYLISNVVNIKSAIKWSSLLVRDILSTAGPFKINV
jgi:hypothetical protein